MVTLWIMLPSMQCNVLALFIIIFLTSEIYENAARIKYYMYTCEGEYRAIRIAV